MYFFSPQKHSKCTSLILQQNKVYEVSRLPTLTPSPLARFLTGVCPKCFLTEINSIPLACLQFKITQLFPHSDFRYFPPQSFPSSFLLYSSFNSPAPAVSAVQSPVLVLFLASSVGLCSAPLSVTLQSHQDPCGSKDLLGCVR